MFPDGAEKQISDLSEREKMFIDFESIINARELGSIETIDGRRVKSGLLLRTAGLDTASAGDIEKLSGHYGIRHIFDFRDPDECRRHPDVPVPGAEYHSLPALPALPEKNLEDRTGDDGPPDFDRVFRRIYTQLALEDPAAEAYGEFFRTLLEGGVPRALALHPGQGPHRHRRPAASHSSGRAL